MNTASNKPQFLQSHISRSGRLYYRYYFKIVKATVHHIFQ